MELMEYCYNFTVKISTSPTCRTSLRLTRIEDDHANLNLLLILIRTVLDRSLDEIDHGVARLH